MKVNRCLLLGLILVLFTTVFSDCAPKAGPANFDQLHVTDRMKLDFAEQFSVEYYEGGYKLITLGDGSRFLTVPEGAQLPTGLDASITPLYQPIQNIYLAATSAMCLFDALDRLDAIRLSGTKEDGWYVENARTAMREGRILYAGKYSEPDYELLLEQNASLAVESMMIGHASAVKEQLERLGIPVLTDQSSNETHPLGRAEWIRLYGALLNEEPKAEELFREQVRLLNEVEEENETGKTVAFFYIGVTGRVVARRTGDYVSKMISLAGGDYAFGDLGDPDAKTSTVTLEMEAFYAAAKDADILIYNATIGDNLYTLEELLQKHELLKDFKAVKDGQVWCTTKSMYQETTALGQMIQSLHRIFTDDEKQLDEVPFFYRLK